MSFDRYFLDLTAFLPRLWYFNGLILNWDSMDLTLDAGHFDSRAQFASALGPDLQLHTADKHLLDFLLGSPHVDRHLMDSDEEDFTQLALQKQYIVSGEGGTVKQFSVAHACKSDGCNCSITMPVSQM